MPTPKRYWLSLDLGLQGDYEDLYSWLDRNGAKECGDNVATFVSDKDRNQIAAEVSALVTGQRNPRIYLISATKDYKGGFIVGKRKFPPWKGYAELESDAGEET